MAERVSPLFWQTKTLQQMNETEWEKLCDGCGKCCFRKYTEIRRGKEILYYTRIACDLLDLKSSQCSDYSRRFEKMPDCTKLTRHNLPLFHWLPSTCAYRLLYEGKSLYPWHPLISGDSNSVIKAGIPIKNAIHDSQVIDWFEWIIDEDEV